MRGNTSLSYSLIHFIQDLFKNYIKVNARAGFRDRERIGASLADVDPMDFDKSITFKSVGGHPGAIRQLQEELQ